MERASKCEVSGMRKRSLVEDPAVRKVSWELPLRGSASRARFFKVKFEGEALV